MMQHCLIDWLSIKENNVGFPILNDGRSIHLDKNGAILFESAKRFRHEGSHSSAVIVRVTEEQREISFSPSRFNRLDNVFGVTFEEALDAVNDVWRQLEQPPMAAPVWRSAALKQGYVGPVITRLDATLNVATGNPEEAERYLRALAATKLDRRKTRRDRGTLYWGKSAVKRIIKAYNKAVELRDHASKRDDPKEIEPIAKWCEKVGLVRLEVRYGRDWLREKGWRDLGAVTHKAITAQLEKDLAPMLNDVAAEDIAKLTRMELGTLAIWLRGYDVREGISQATFYRHRRAIKRKTGYDIATDILCLEAKPQPFKLTYPGPPAWYEMPKFSQLKRG
jgi:hypothetical protein